MYPAFVFPGSILPTRIDGRLSKQLDPDPSEGDGALAVCSESSFHRLGVQCDLCAGAVLLAQASLCVTHDLVRLGDRHVAVYADVHVDRIVVADAACL